ncbi:MAG: hypothetical protein GX864_00880 [Mollicutes bacterium]|jgi:hypothetical protein|nr:hypothetical protein [Mollicutes bacterium]
MKEASGELNMTAITILAIAAVGAFFYLVIWPGLRNNIERSQQCSSAVCGVCTNGKQTCSYTNKDGKIVTDLECPCKEEIHGPQ